ncbi:MAG: sn-glycerol-1-phosphate dehydrogenase [Nitrososphaerales archaeon]|nr:sn-glycerol-1-phosphate dehydrogenase [Nitrososphaerales archaeon]
MSGNRHEMDLPKRILVGNGVIKELGSFLDNLGYQVVHIVTGPHIIKKVKKPVETILTKKGFKVNWSEINIADMKTIQYITGSINQKTDIMIGLGGGKTVDAAKLTAFNTNLPYISIPTSASHDGISSPFASIKGSGRPYSIITNSPLGIIADLDIIGNAPIRLLASGCGDLIGKVTAVKDWEIERSDKGSYFGKYAASLAHLSADIVIGEAKNIGLGTKDSVRDVVEALLSAGVAAGIAGSSRPCSGSEHLFAHALDIQGSNNGLHGEKVGLGTILMAKLHGINWENIVKALEDIHAPTKGKDIGLEDKRIVKAILQAKKIRPNRYTILGRKNLDEPAAFSLARSTNVI